MSSIQINGKTYDANTGGLINDIAAPVKRPLTPHTTVKDADATVHKLASRQHKPRTAHAVHQKTKKGKTLMRSLVQQPTLVVTKGPKHSSTKTDAHFDTVPTLPHPSSQNPRRLLRAEQVQQSKHISRFGDIINTPIMRSPESTVVKTPEPVSISTTAASYPITHRAADDIFINAIHHAHSHEQEPYKKPHLHHRIARKAGIGARALSIATGSAAIALLVGFFAIQNVQSMNIRIASRNAGITAKLPEPVSGYSQNGPIKYSPGNVTISFKSSSDSRDYITTQRTSNWNSEALRENFVALKNQPYRTEISRGRTIYLFGQGNATWVDGGIWYSIEGNENISSEQLLAVASSL